MVGILAVETTGDLNLYDLIMALAKHVSDKFKYIFYLILYIYIYIVLLCLYFKV